MNFASDVPLDFLSVYDANQTNIVMSTDRPTSGRNTIVEIGKRKSTTTDKYICGNCSGSVLRTGYGQEQPLEREHISPKRCGKLWFAESV